MQLTPGIFVGTTTFIVGSDKHAGKTTLLNYLIRPLRHEAPLVYLSVGLDGEGRDALSGVPKPHVVAEAGDWLVTAEQALRRSDVSAEIREVFPFETVLGAPVLAHVVRGGPIELIGPGSNAALARILMHIVADAGIETVLVDGAINRITQVAASTQAACVYVLRVDRAGLPRAIDAMRRLAYLQAVPVAMDDASDDATRVLDGALTTEKAGELDAGCRTLIVEDFSHVFLTYAELRNLQRRAELRFRRRVAMRAFVVNLYDVSRDEFLDRLTDTGIIDKVIFNPYQEVA
ncbi:MAG: hypothetical protein JXA69_06185 [Phycisphaerae bacterium]|nr:hypothetical protein [Phycisphaerae bacterium]